MFRQCRKGASAALSLRASAMASAFLAQHLQVEQEGNEYRIIQIHVEDKPAADEPMKEAKGEMPGMDHSQHQMGDKS